MKTMPLRDLLRSRLADAPADERARVLEMLGEVDDEIEKLHLDCPCISELDLDPRDADCGYCRRSKRARVARAPECSE